MNGIWFAAMFAFLVATGVAAQLGWEPPPISQVIRAVRLGRPRAQRPPVDDAVDPVAPRFPA